MLTESTVRNFANEDQTITITDPNSGHNATILTVPRGPPPFLWASSLWKPHSFSQIKELINHNDDLAIIVSFNSVNSSLYFEAYTHVPSFSLSVLSRIYLSTCDFPDSTCNTFSRQNTPPTASQDLLPFVDLFLSQKKEYKPIAKRT